MEPNGQSAIEHRDKFEGWAMVELMGHKKLAGQCSEQVVAGAALLRIDVPETQQRKTVPGYGGTVVESKPGYTKLVGVGSVYCITPTTEEVARRCAEVIERWNDPIPVDLPKLLPATASVAGDTDAGTQDDLPFETAGRDDDDDETLGEDDDDLPSQQAR
jgi:hypothetical protein